MNNIIPSILQKYKIEEIRINVPWGYMAGKLWGPKNIRPILLFHGWQENAGTYDRLIPLLPKEMSYLAIDLPGHGLSSHIPIGMSYNIMDAVHLINVIAATFKWDKVSLLSHSMGGQQNFIYNAMFPDRCDMTLSLDTIKPLIRPTENAIKSMRDRLEQNLIEYQRQINKSKPPTYTYDKMIEMIVKSSGNSVTKECAPYLMNRAIAESDSNENQFYFTRDNRVKNFSLTPFDWDLVADMAKLIRSPYLFIKADWTYFDDKKYTDYVMDIMRKNISDFEYGKVASTHHVHLVAPELIAPRISSFIQRNRIEKN